MENRGTGKRKRAWEEGGGGGTKDDRLNTMHQLGREGGSTKNFTSIT